MPHWAKYLEWEDTDCPFCKMSDCVEGEFIEIVGDSATQTMDCTNCGASWDAWRDLVDISNGKTDQCELSHEVPN